jgi:hypothetical protein
MLRDSELAWVTLQPVFSQETQVPPGLIIDSINIYNGQCHVAVTHPIDGFISEFWSCPISDKKSKSEETGNYENEWSKGDIEACRAFTSCLDEHDRSAFSIVSALHTPPEIFN